jgi:hypothetical protein
LVSLLVVAMATEHTRSSSRWSMPSSVAVTVTVTGWSQFVLLKV